MKMATMDWQQHIGIVLAVCVCHVWERFTHWYCVMKRHKLLLGLYHGRDATTRFTAEMNMYLDRAGSPPWCSSTQSSDRTADTYVPLPSTSAIYDPAAQTFPTNDTDPPCSKQTIHHDKSNMIDWVRLNVRPTQYRSYGYGFLRVKWPNQQCQSTEGTHKMLNQIEQSTTIHLN